MAQMIKRISERALIIIESHGVGFGSPQGQPASTADLSILPHARSLKQ